MDSKQLIERYSAAVTQTLHALGCAETPTGVIGRLVIADYYIGNPDPPRMIAFFVETEESKKREELTMMGFSQDRRRWELTSVRFRQNRITLPLNAETVEISLYADECDNALIKTQSASGEPLRLSFVQPYFCNEVTGAYSFEKHFLEYLEKRPVTPKVDRIEVF